MYSKGTSGTMSSRSRASKVAAGSWVLGQGIGETKVAVHGAGVSADFGTIVFGWLALDQ